MAWPVTRGNVRGTAMNNSSYERERGNKIKCLEWKKRREKQGDYVTSIFVFTICLHIVVMVAACRLVLFFFNLKLRVGNIDYLNRIMIFSCLTLYSNTSNIIRNLKQQQQYNSSVEKNKRKICKQTRQKENEEEKKYLEPQPCNNVAATLFWGKEKERKQNTKNRINNQQNKPQAIFVTFVPGSCWTAATTTTNSYVNNGNRNKHTT